MTLVLGGMTKTTQAVLHTACLVQLQNSPLSNNVWQCEVPPLCVPNVLYATHSLGYMKNSYHKNKITPVFGINRYTAQHKMTCYKA